jgi:cold shock CspA family protein
VGAISKQPSHRGEVLFFKLNEDETKGFGFIVPEDGGRDRWENVWFGLAETLGRVLQSGDLVDFILSKYPAQKHGPRAYRVFLRTSRADREDRNAITHTGGNW